MSDKQPDKPKPAKKRGPNKRIALAKNVKEAIAGYGADIGTATSPDQLFDITLLLGIALGRAREGGVDDTTMGFAEDLARQHMSRALNKTANLIQGAKAE